MAKNKPKSKKFEVYGRARIIRDVRTDTETDFEAYYRNCYIHVQLDDDPGGSTYAWVTAPSGSYIVDGYLRTKNGLEMTMDEAIKECLENILWKEKENVQTNAQASA